MRNYNKDSELVIGIIAPIGTNTEIAVSLLKNQLKKFRYTTEEIFVSRDVISQFTNNPDSYVNEYNRIKAFMSLGNDIRLKTKDSSILMQGVVANIYKQRQKINSNVKVRERIAYIVRTIKHPEEVSYLREVYGDGFHLIGISSSIEQRKHFLIEQLLMSETEALELLERDTNEKDGHGQHTRDAYQLSDYFIDVCDSLIHIESAISRLVDLFFGEPFITPSFEEFAMFMAYASSLRSADLSRQVGAVISRNQEIIAYGANDCPKFGGGLYWPVMGDNGELYDREFGRDYKNEIDPNKNEQKKIYDNIFSVLKDINIPNRENVYSDIRACGINDLTEYGRVVHGEMEALLTCARNNISCRDAVMFVTTFPCHNCAKHIIAAGIKEVVYIEPYPKSKAFQFYKAEITEVTKDMENKILFRPFVGVGPHKFIDLFAMSSIKWYTRARKDADGNKVSWTRNQANLRNPMSFFTYLDLEKVAVIDFENSLNCYYETKPKEKKLWRRRKRQEQKSVSKE